MSVEFGDPVVIERVDGHIGSIPVRWELTDWRVELDITTQERQEQRFIAAWNRFNVLSAPHRRRLVAALHYFHVGCRLKREAKTPGEFLAEALLNFAKVLEILYGPARDGLRASLMGLDYVKEEIESDFIPLLLLRNSMDVGHPLLALFTSSELQTLHRYAERAEATIRELLKRLFRKVETGNYDVSSYECSPVDQATRQTLQALRQHLDKLEEKP